LGQTLYDLTKEIDGTRQRAHPTEQEDLVGLMEVTKSVTGPVPI